MTCACGIFSNAVVYRTICPDPRYELHLYVAIAPVSFLPQILETGANAITPVQKYIRPRAAVCRDENGCQINKSPLERQATDRTSGASKQYGCGRRFELEETIRFRGLVSQRQNFNLKIISQRRIRPTKPLVPQYLSTQG
jgi:hypothetical protein